jgi:chorismate lyase/3-hydroxybenzoate synthase
MLLRHAQDTSDTGSFVHPRRAIYKVYVRHESDLEEIRQVIEDTPLSQTQPLFLQGDLCRRELLVEIEAIVTSD